MLKIWLIGIILFFINFIALRKFIQDIDDFDEWAIFDEWAMTFFFFFNSGCWDMAKYLLSGICYP